MNFMYKKFRIYFSYLVLIAFTVCSVSKIFADDTQKNRASVVLNNNEKLLSQIKNKKQACNLLEHKIVTYVDLSFYVKDCKLLRIKDPEVFNHFIQIQKKSVISLSAEIYSMIPMGGDYSNDKYYDEFANRSGEPLRELCQKYEQCVVTSDNINYYYIDSCKKKLFKNFNDVSLFTKRSKPIYSLEPGVLKKIPTGNSVVIPKQNTNSMENLSASEIKANLPSIKKLCEKLERRVVSFHDSFFFVENCKLLTIADFNLEIQKAADGLGGIKELTVIQAIGIPEAGTITSKDVLKKIR